MAITAAQINTWRGASSESQVLEFKEAKTSFDRDKLCAYCVALANEGGGHLLLGIGDKPPRPIVGSSAFPNLVSIADDLFRRLGFRVEVDEVSHSEGRVVVFSAPARPRGTAYHLEGRYLMRSGASLVSMSEDVLRSIFAEGGPNWLEEGSVSSLTAQDIIEVLDTQGFFQLLKTPYPTDRKGVINRLCEQKLIDRFSDGYSIRRIGALLLAKKLDDFPDVSRKAARVIIYTSTSKSKPKIDQLGGKGYAVGFQGLVAFIMQQLPQNEIIKDALSSTLASYAAWQRA